ncbi:iron-siderophore ABC transporter substrate-binding protein [Pseudoclavibacter sp. CFCC 13796]|uniref:ABC transporter substrate-binding protein n=1 Tax=Pseudoclavibacter sp. CFCC 13796 TaxID=2615179 RepID=UPI001300EA39|nr:iron-siderophore ABC transporter substrate-binding protein [Pseudoclavibacter sp. CFCC 13796]KAB1659960.1 iron-siderophore ABC transporter substrate-binding protein [Pseudoclavibacter sp. CFCC 13796]
MIGLFAALAVSLGLAGCGVVSGGSSDSTADAQGNRTITDSTGAEVTIPASPKKVVTLSEPTLDGALALDVTPAGTTSGRGQKTAPGYLGDRAASIPIVSDVANPNFEEIGKLKPDLILTDGTSINDDAQIQQLKAIAPVVIAGEAGGSWRDNFGIVADALNKADDGKKVVQNYDDHVQQVKSGLGTYQDKTFSIVRWQGNTASLILKELLPGQALEDLGLKRPENQDRAGAGHSEPVSLENLSEIDADYMFFGTLGGSSVGNADAGGATDEQGAKDALRQAVAVPGFTDLNVYKQQHVFLVDGSRWTSTGGPILMDSLITDVQQKLDGAQ